MNALSLLRLILNGTQNRPDVIYDLLSTNNNLGRKSLYLNLGYWESATTYDDACDALADLLGEAAALKPEDELLDVGFGFADQDIRWVEQFTSKSIIGINLTASQVSTAQRRVAERGMEERVRLLCASATRLPFPDSSFDKITALETAFHYDTREVFFREAWRVLRPGGRLALADILPLEDPVSLNWFFRLAQLAGPYIWQIPEANFYPWTEYEAKLRGAGFREIRARSIREQVYLPFSRYMRGRLNDSEITARMDWLVRLIWKVIVPGLEREMPLDYLIVTADKE